MPAHGETAPAFTLTASGLAGLANSSVAWGDMDNNGRLDLVLTGTDAAFTPRARVWRNEGNNQFTNATAGSPDCRLRAAGHPCGATMTMTVTGIFS